jgi:hypothetical protein
MRDRRLQSDGTSLNSCWSKALQNQDNMIHVKATRLTALSDRALEMQSHDFTNSVDHSIFEVVDLPGKPTSHTDPLSLEPRGRARRSLIWEFQVCGEVPTGLFLQEPSGSPQRVSQVVTYM